MKNKIAFAVRIRVHQKVIQYKTLLSHTLVMINYTKGNVKLFIYVGYSCRDQLLHENVVICNKKEEIVSNQIYSKPVRFNRG